MSREVLRYIMNGMVEMNGARYWRICDLENNKRALDFLKTPAALVLIDEADPQRSFDRARALWHALNDYERDRELIEQVVTPAERRKLLETGLLKPLFQVDRGEQ